MDVYLIPFSADRHQLYCEPSADADTEGDGDARGTGLFDRTMERVRRMLVRLDVPDEAPHQAPPRTWHGRARRRVARWTAAKVAEQRLLWRLRRIASARVFFPDDLTEAEASATVQRLLRRDADRHRRWMVVHLVALVPAVFVLGPIFLIVPGVANLPAVYFGFRAFGHFLSMQGARNGLKNVTWTYAPSDALTALRHLDTLRRPERARRIDEVAARLGLTSFSRFCKRTALWGA